MSITVDDYIRDLAPLLKEANDLKEEPNWFNRMIRMHVNQRETRELKKKFFRLIEGDKDNALSGGSQD